ncbi:MAG: dTDP-4-dehydrorhamnose reductase [Vulcanimicrobiaceae bacterium]
MRVTILGAAGQLGSALAAAYAGEAPVLVTHDRFDVEDTAAIATLLHDARPDVLINTTAFHNVERCEREPERAFAINAIAVETLAAACADADVAFAHVSTDYVFDGRRTTPYGEDDAPNPLNIYGVSKLAGELLVRRRAARTFVFRTSGLYAALGISAKGKPFIERMLEGAAVGTPLRVVGDVTFSPSYAGHVAQAMRLVIEREAYGLYHITNRGACTWHEFATAILARSGYDASIERTTSVPGTVRRPAYSALAHHAMDALGLPPMPAWQAGIDAYIEERNAAPPQGRP